MIPFAVKVGSLLYVKKWRAKCGKLFVKRVLGSLAKFICVVISEARQAILSIAITRQYHVHGSGTEIEHKENCDP